MDTFRRDAKFEAWKHGLLDVSRRNRLINYRRTKRATLRIAADDPAALYRRLCVSGEAVAFRRLVDTPNDQVLTALFALMERAGAPVELTQGELRSDMSVREMNITLRQLRARSRTALEEQGINILYAVFGFLRWRQKPGDEWMLSPLILVPVSLELTSITSPYMLRKLDEDTVVNPTLLYALSSEMGLELPEFDAVGGDPEAYLAAVEALGADSGWQVERSVELGLLSFLKIIMYEDLQKHREQIFAHPAVRAFCGDISGLPAVSEEALHMDHDAEPSAARCLVMPADASQLDAVALSRQGASFVLQGPPGTGKSQTIANIIAQSIADGRTVLFVAEKMAALSVVHRRLALAGLEDACLSLHNYKAEKRAVLQELVNTLDAPRRQMRQGTAAVYDALDTERAQLNGYITALTEVREPLHRSLWEAISEVSGMESVPQCLLSEDVTDLSAEDYEKRIAALKRLAAFLRQSPEIPADNPWRGSAVERLPAAELEQAPALAARLQAQLLGVLALMQFVDPAGAGERQWADFARLCRLARGEALLRETRDRRDGGEKLAAQCDAWTRARAEAEQLMKARAAASEEELDAVLGQEEAALADCAAFFRDMKNVLGEPVSADRESLARCAAALRMLLLPFDFSLAWYQPGQYEELRRRTEELRPLAEELRGLRARIDRDWNSAVYDLDAEAVAERYREACGSFLRRLLSASWSEDRRQLSAAWRRPGSPDDAEVLAGMELLAEYQRRRAELRRRVTELPALSGTQPGQAGLDWDEWQQRLQDGALIRDYLAKYPLAEKLAGLLAMPAAQRQRMVLHGEPLAKMAARAEKAGDALAGCGGRPVEDCLAEVRRQRAVLEDLRGARHNLAELFGTDENGAERCAARLIAVRGCLRDVENDCAESRRALGLTEGPDAAELASLLEGWLTPPAEDWARRLLGNPAAPYPEADVQALRDELARACAEPEELTAFLALFPGEDLRAVPLEELNRRCGRCAEPAALRSHLQWAEACRPCLERGLGEYLDWLSAEKLLPELTVPVYRKAFLTKWISGMLWREDLRPLLNFRVWDHEETIAAYREHGEAAEAVAQARLAEKLSEARPAAVTRLYGAMDEVSILRREADKKRRIMPLRKLFRSVPVLLQKLKPCFMMSPLSVAYFLDSDLYHFDLVIFDEASQILPEDAIGAIYRGSQVIIAGDTKQMPPTSFFAAAVNGGADFDREEDDDEADGGVSESILDEANACLPSCTLLWHYRSKDETLIAFSNRELYGNRLITFPGSGRRQLSGTEYIYVPDGVYESSGRRCNRREAEKCVELLEKHLRETPERSVGIIAFSERQQQAIEDEVNAFRLRHPEYEAYFAEDREEPFFVKNLENVQGDERDTIIFSICYARNAEGRMYQRFGPLMNEGGERRLNVAITRAKYSVQLVGSILPTDIVVKEGTGEGVRLLREYIYYAMQVGGTAPQQPEERGTGDPFPDEVAAFLRSRGYSSRRNVGASDYRVDIAVIDPEQPERFLCGIECDSAHYSMARTAWDRDVLRGSVMRGMGWRLHHVWSMAWYASPETEKQRLLRFVEAAAGKSASPEAPAQGGSVSAEGLLTAAQEDTGALTFGPYVRANPLDAPVPRNLDSAALLAARALWVLRAEAPMHREEFHRRMARVFGNEKTRVTEPIRRALDRCVAETLAAEVTVRGDFLYVNGQAVRPRSPADGEEPRPLEHVAPEEIRAAVNAVLRSGLGLTEKDLEDEVLARFGFPRTGPRMKIIWKQTMLEMRRDGVLREHDGRLYPAEGGGA